jgi:hypothetical protein
MQIESTSTEPTWRRFVSEAESNQQLADLLRRKAEATKVLTELNTKLEQLATRFHEVGDNLRRYVEHEPHAKLYEDVALSNSLRFGPDSGINADVLVGMIQERDRQSITIEGVNANLRNRGYVV